MDKRKLELVDQKKQASDDALNEMFSVQDIVNSKKVNDAMILNAEEMFEMEFLLKQKA